MTRWPVTGSADDALLGRRYVYFTAGRPRIETPIYARDRLGASVRLEGPCIVEEETSTTVILPGQALAVDAFGSLICVTGNSDEPTV